MRTEGAPHAQLDDRGARESSSPIWENLSACASPANGRRLSGRRSRRLGRGDLDARRSAPTAG